MNDQALEYARQSGYLTSQGNDTGLQKAWLGEVVDMGLPYVEIVLSRQGARQGTGARLAFETSHLDPRVASAIKTVFRRYLEQHRGPKANYSTAMSGAIGPLPVEDAKDLASQILTLASPDRAA